MKTAPASTVKTVALAISLVELVVVALIWVGYTPAATGYQFAASADWIPALGIGFSVGIDGVALVMIALIAVLVPIVLGASWEEKLPAGRTIGGYFALLLVLESTMMAVFAATDVFVFYVAFELMLIPMYFLIGAFGGPRRTYAATKFFLYSLFGGLMMLASVIGLYVTSKSHTATGVGTLDWAELRAIADQIPESTQMWIFAGFAIAFAIKAPLFPLHSWLPDAGAEAPVGSGTLIVGVLDKVGTFGFLRICLPLLPAASAKLAPVIITLSVIGIFYGGLVAAGQRDLKRFVTFTSIAHFGFIAMGVFAFTTQAMSGAVFYMVAHGLATGLLFLVVGMLTARGGSRLVGDYGGVWKVAPLLAGMFLIGSLATIALPGTSSFVAEFLVLLGTFATQPVWGAIATVGIVVAAIYMLWIFQRTMTGPVRGAGVLLPEPDLGAVPGGGSTGRLTGSTSTAVLTAPARHAVLEDEEETGQENAHSADPLGAVRARLRFGDLKAREIAVLTPLVALILLLGVYPKPVLDVINPTAAQIVTDSGHSDPAPAIEGANP
ncbi:NADH-quinone oxidoreductase subunit M [Nakamurella deserti]|uniref:NADH-quinone oxidoreductase subunit M n=1 Tax=Nakamurella deserti TaxID=2164074 RepID=UPI003B82ECA6